MYDSIKTTKTNRWGGKKEEFTIADIPEDDLEKVLTGVGFPKGNAKNMQAGWPRGTKLTRKALQDFAAGAANESDQQKQA